MTLKKLVNRNFRGIFDQYLTIKIIADLTSNLTNDELAAIKKINLKE